MYCTEAAATSSCITLQLQLRPRVLLYSYSYTLVYYTAATACPQSSCTALKLHCCKHVLVYCTKTTDSYVLVYCTALQLRPLYNYIYRYFLLQLHSHCNPKYCRMMFPTVLCPPSDAGGCHCELGNVKDYCKTLKTVLWTQCTAGICVYHMLHPLYYVCHHHCALHFECSGQGAPVLWVLQCGDPLYFECIAQCATALWVHCAVCSVPLQCGEPLLVGQYPAFRHISSVCLSVWVPCSILHTPVAFLEWEREGKIRRKIKGKEELKKTFCLSFCI